MIITTNELPSRSLYYLGAMTITVLFEYQFGVIGSSLLYEKVNEKLALRISFSHFNYVLDWLYLIDIISLNEHGDIKKCF